MSWLDPDLAALAALPESEITALRTLVALLDAQVLADLASHASEACNASVQAREQHLIVDFRARRGRIHDALMSHPKLTGRRNP